MRVKSAYYCAFYCLYICNCMDSFRDIFSPLPKNSLASNSIATIP